ncbi:flagellar biosynthesis protein FlhG [Crenobacter luteus]|uniref:Flagellar synthesis regulator FleN n=1 Tax=Crenobacter luteus TaxID=1452487 RepID=A0A161R7M4_9NEIS|nr:flagellar synthesis regulator FleN [Crenobacter luteus]KZE32658.1 flagellar synthesis regulator FleN [Crenobacter luteus]TCP10844.1 flagellar biosynthesis protein FlhG [Crenobacter luteus]
MQDQAASLRRLSPRPARAPSFAFVGAPGSGTSTLATELAVAASYAGTRTVLIDCQNGQQLARRLGVPSTATLETQRVSQGGLAAMSTASRHGVDLINLYAPPLERRLFSPQLWLKLTGEFAARERDADALIVDCPSPSLDAVPAGVADNLILVLTPSADSLTAAYAAIKRLAQEAGRSAFNVLVNRARTLAEARGLFTRLSAVVGEFLAVSLRWLGFVPEDNLVRRSQSLRRPLVEAFPDSEAAQAFAQLAAVMPHWHGAEHGRRDAGYLDMLIAASRDWSPDGV